MAAKSQEIPLIFIKITFYNYVMTQVSFPNAEACQLYYTGTCFNTRVQRNACGNQSDDINILVYMYFFLKIVHLIALKANIILFMN